MSNVLRNARNTAMASIIMLTTAFGAQAQNDNTLASNTKPKTENKGGNLVPITKADLTHEPYGAADLAAASSTKDGQFITILVRSDDPAIIEHVESGIRGLYHMGHTNVAMIIGPTKDGQNEVELYDQGELKRTYLHVSRGNGPNSFIASYVMERNSGVGMVKTPVPGQ